MIVQGYCPMGCGRTLVFVDGGYITCSYVNCPEPTAVTRLLAVGEVEHVVTFEPDGFHVEHPLRERLDGGLLRCELHRWLIEHEPPATTGRYRVTSLGGAWRFDPIR